MIYRTKKGTLFFYDGVLAWQTKEKGVLMTESQLNNCEFIANLPISFLERLQGIDLDEFLQKRKDPLVDVFCLEWVLKGDCFLAKKGLEK